MADRQTSLAPYPLAMIVCEGVWRDPVRGKHTLHGIFSVLDPRGLPIQPVFTVYVSLTGGRGKTPIRLEFVDVDEERPAVFCIEGEVNFPDPQTVAELCLSAGRITISHAGEYRLKLFAAGEFLMERRIVVARPTEQKPSV